MGIKRIVDRDFWLDPLVLDCYSPEDCLFHLYLMTGPESSQLGIYRLPRRRIAFDLGFEGDLIDQLLTRFQEVYQVIAYDSLTQEVAVLDALTYNIVRGGTPVVTCLGRELDAVKSLTLLQVTYQHLLDFWRQSARPFDQKVQSLFEDRLSRSQGLAESLVSQEPNDKEKNNDNDNVNDNENEVSGPESGSDSLSDSQGLHLLESRSTKKVWQQFLLDSSDLPAYLIRLSLDLGHLSIQQVEDLADLADEFGDQLLTEAISLASKAREPYPYFHGIINNWRSEGIKDYQTYLNRPGKKAHSYIEPISTWAKARRVAG